MRVCKLVPVSSHSYRATNRRLSICLLLSAVVVFVALLPFNIQFTPQGETPQTPLLELRFKNPPAEEIPVQKAANAEVDSDVPEHEQQADNAPADAPAIEEQNHGEADLGAEREVDWYAELRNAATDPSNFGEEKKYMGDFGKRLQAAAQRYYPSPETGQRPIWENIEKDQLGRSILWHGDCYRVLSDPNVMNLYVFETFTQHLIFCQKPYDVARNLPWVQDVIAKYSYLQDDSDIYAN